MMRIISVLFVLLVISFLTVVLTTLSESQNSETMAADWSSPFDVLPSDAQVVYIRILDYYGEPFLATYNASNQEFTTNETGVVVPVYYVVRWKDS